MGLRIQNNVEAFNTHRQLSATGVAASKSMEKLSSGYRINRAADDAAGLAISEKMRGQIGGLAQAQRNAQDGISLVQTAEGALTEVHSMLQRVRDLTVQYKNDTLSQDDKDAIIGEVFQLAKEVREIGEKTQFNSKNLLDGTTYSFQVGANDSETIGTTAADLVTQAGVTTVLDVAYTNAAAVTAGTSFDPAVPADMTTMRARMNAVTTALVDTGITNVSKIRSDMGAVQNRLEHRLANLATYQENLTASESRIRDVDMAAEMTKFTKLNILQQAGTSMLAQANQAPQGVLSLLR
jgi:flagellin